MLFSPDAQYYADEKSKIRGDSWISPLDVMFFAMRDILPTDFDERMEIYQNFLMPNNRAGKPVKIPVSDVA